MHDPTDLELRTLLRGHIATYEQLDTLLFLHRAAGGRTVAAVAEELKLPPRDVAQALERLSAAQLVRTDTASEAAVFHCAPGSPDLARAVNRLAEVDAANRVKVVELMAETAIDRLRERTTQAFERFSADRVKQR
ncbi:MAG: MarR family transcriptional regulator [Polyangiaceae bacterium]